MTALAFDADATLVERHATTLFVLLLVAIAAAALTSAEHSLFAGVIEALSAGVAR